MTKQNKPKKLALDATTLRNLSIDQTRVVVGGMRPYSAGWPTACTTCW